MKNYLNLIASILLFNFSIYSQSNFNFWQGTWDVYSTKTGKKDGVNTIKLVLNNKVLFENWNGVSGYQGQSFTLFDSAQNCWRQTWVDFQSNQLDFYGILRNDSMVFITKPYLNKNQKLEIQRMLIILKSENELNQIGEISHDNSATWSLNYDLTYKKNPHSAMQSILAQDDILGKQRNINCKIKSISETILIYVKDLSALDYSNCPEAFQDAFQEHRTAWLNLLVITDKYPKLRGEMHELFKKIEKSSDKEEFKVLLKQVWSSWDKIEKENIQ